MPSAAVEPHLELIDQMTNDPEDRHVLATAVVAEAGFVVTFNTRDFPAAACAAQDVVAESPDAFAVEIIDHLSLRLPEAMRQLRAALPAGESEEHES